MLAVIQLYGEPQTDTAPTDTAAVDSVAVEVRVIPNEPQGIVDPELAERGLVLGTVLTMLVGFGVLVGLKKREADRRAGLD